MAAVNTAANKENDTKIVNNTDSAPKVIESVVINGDKKEQETVINNNNPNTKPNAKSDNNNPNAEELLAQGTKLMDEKKYNLASNLLSQALQIFQTKHTAKATSIECVEYYMAYGQSLLRLIQSSNDLFAAPIRQSQQNHITEGEEDDDIEAPTLITDATETDTNANDTEKQNNSKHENEDANENENENANNNSNIKENDVEINEDREIAWETLEYARTIIEDHLAQHENDNKYIKTLGMTHSLLGELLIEDENNEPALQEFETALECYDQCNERVECRQIAFDRFMACLAAQFCGKDEIALKHCHISLHEISQRMIELLKELKCATVNEECKENEYDHLMQIAKEFIGKMNEEQKNNANGKELMNLRESMTDLMCKLEEVKENIKFKKENKGNDMMNNNNNNNGDIFAGDDPLSALINGLTSKFGINEQQLADFEQCENKNNINNTNNNNNSGVTTIGFGNGTNDKSDNEDIDVIELGSFGGNKNKNKNSKRKRTLDEAGIEYNGGMDGKKVKLNSGKAVSPMVESEMVENNQQKE